MNVFYGQRDILAVCHTHMVRVKHTKKVFIHFPFLARKIRANLKVGNLCHPRCKVNFDPPLLFICVCIVLTLSSFYESSFNFLKEEEKVYGPLPCAAS